MGTFALSESERHCGTIRRVLMESVMEPGRMSIMSWKLVHIHIHEMRPIPFGAGRASTGQGESIIARDVFLPAGQVKRQTGAHQYNNASALHHRVRPAQSIRAAECRAVVKERRKKMGLGHWWLVK